jgi:hypothetical protein
MHEAGLAAFAHRDPAKTGVYSFETEDGGLGAEFEAEFRRDEAAWGGTSVSHLAIGALPPTGCAAPNVTTRAVRGSRRS